MSFAGQDGMEGQRTECGSIDNLSQSYGLWLACLCFTWGLSTLEPLDKYLNFKKSKMSRNKSPVDLVQFNIFSDDYSNGPVSTSWH